MKDKIMSFCFKHAYRFDDDGRVYIKSKLLVRIGSSILEKSMKR